ncbi:hypothetical protein B2J88_01735 [Rhodococcus sp. SRB_17]|nr:hypothetical protein [Rhodococcus sp. SRB_17]
MCWLLLGTMSIDQRFFVGFELLRVCDRSYRLAPERSQFAMLDAKKFIHHRRRKVRIPRIV